MNIVITGASAGIGYETALALASKPENRILALARRSDKLAQLAQTAQQRWGHQNIIPLSFSLDLDFSNHHELLAVVQQWEVVDVLINNAGKLLSRPFTHISDNEWQEVFAANFFGPIRLMRFLFPFLEKSKAAHVVNIGSMGGVQGSSKFAGLSPYSSSKAALANLTECLAEEWRETSIRTNCLALGAVQTEMLAAAFPGYEAPLSSADMGEFVAWFATQGHRFFNGKILPVALSTP